MFAIAPYYFSVLDDRRQPQDLSVVNNNLGLQSAINDFFISELDVPHDRKNHQSKKMYVLRKLYTGSVESIAGCYQTGLYGYESEIWDVSSKLVAHNRTIEQADMFPFMFCMYFPKINNSAFRRKGLLLLGRFNNFGIRGILMPRVIQHIANSMPGLTLQVEKIAPTAVIKTLLSQGKVKKIRLVKKTLPSDFASVLSDSDKSSFLDLEYVFRPKRKSFFTDVDWILNIASQKVGVNNVFALPDFKPDNIKVEIVHGGRSRVIDLNNQGKVSPNIDITGDVRCEPSGFPTAASWLEEADSIASEIFESWGLGKKTFLTQV